MAYTASTLLIEEGEGEVTDSAVVKVRAQQLGGAFSIMEGELVTDQLLTPHSHTHEDQCIFVIDGEAEFEVGGEGGERFTAPRGSYVIKPRGIPHAFWNKKSTTFRYIELSGGRGFEQFVDSTRFGTVKAGAEAQERFGITFYMDQVPRLMKQHGLTSLRAVESPAEKLKSLAEKLKPPFLEG